MYTLDSSDFKDLINGANKGNANSQFRLGEIYYHGSSNPLASFKQEPDHAKAINWYEKAAKQGHTPTKESLKEKAENGDAEIQYLLGTLHDKGIGVPQSKIHAYMWFSIASTNGHKGAKKAVGILPEEMTARGVEKAQEKAADRVERKPDMINLKRN